MLSSQTVYVLKPLHLPSNTASSFSSQILFIHETLGLKAA